MPAKSKAQQALFGMALAVRRGELEKSKVNKEVLDIVNSDMTDKEIEDFASTSHKGLRDHVKESLMDEEKKVFFVIKPGFIKDYAEILHILEDAGFMLLDTNLKKLTLDEAKELYKPHENESFYEELCQYMSSDYSLGMLMCPISNSFTDLFNHVEKLKELIRKKYSVSEMRNTLHGSDSKENVERESKIYFN